MATLETNAKLQDLLGKDMPLLMSPAREEESSKKWNVDIRLPLPILTAEEQAARACDPNLMQLIEGCKNSGVYEGQLIELQREALARWKETDNYRDAYLKKKKKRQPRPKWVPQSREYQLDAIMKQTGPSMLGKPTPILAEKPCDPYYSSEYKKEIKKDSTIPPHEAQKNAYKSLEYQQYYPVPPIPYPGVPLGNTPEEGPWIAVFDSMWNQIWVTLKGLDLEEAAKREEFLGYDTNCDKIA